MKDKGEMGKARFFWDWEFNGDTEFCLIHWFKKLACRIWIEVFDPVLQRSVLFHQGGFPQQRTWVFPSPAPGALGDRIPGQPAPVLLGRVELSRGGQILSSLLQAQASPKPPVLLPDNGHHGDPGPLSEVPPAGCLMVFWGLRWPCSAVHITGATRAAVFCDGLGRGLCFCVGTCGG